MRLRFGSEVGSVQFPVVATVPSGGSYRSQSVYTSFHPLYFFSRFSLNLFGNALIGVLYFGRSVRDKFTPVLGSLQVHSLFSSREYQKSGRTHLFSKFDFVCIFFLSR